MSAIPQLSAVVPRALWRWNKPLNGVASQFAQSWTCETIVLLGDALNTTNRIPTRRMSATTSAMIRMTRAIMIAAPAPADSATGLRVRFVTAMAEGYPATSSLTRQRPREDLAGGSSGALPRQPADCRLAGGPELPAEGFI